MKIQGLDILTNDLSATKRFYNNILGFQIRKETDELISFSAGTSVLSFHKTEIERPVYHFAFTIPMNKIEEALEWMAPKAVLIKLS